METNSFFIYSHSFLSPFLAFFCGHQDESNKVQIPQMGLPLISPTVSDPYLLNRHWSPTLARLSPTNKVQAVALADLIQHFKWKRVSIMYNNDPYGIGHVLISQLIYLLLKITQHRDLRYCDLFYDLSFAKLLLIIYQRFLSQIPCYDL